MRQRLGAAATFLGWLEGDELANTYASADLFVFPSTTDTFGQVILEAQASGLPASAATVNAPVRLTFGMSTATFALIEDYWGMDWVGFVDQLTKLTKGVAFYTSSGELAS